MQIVFEAEDPTTLAAFWADAMGYVVQAPPEGFADWPAYLRSHGVSTHGWNEATAIVDPNGVGPRVLFQRVPEIRSTQNRVHLDLQAGGGPTVAPAEQRRRVEAEVARLTALGATYVLTTEELGIVWSVLLDPEGNEFSA